MAHFEASTALLRLARSFRRIDISDPLTKCLTPRLDRHLASQIELPIAQLAREVRGEVKPTNRSPSSSQIITTLYSWPDLEPLSEATYNPQLLGLPLRRDLLHRAVVFEADASRQGTASTKWRKDVHGSNRKLYAQKGTGQARVGDKKSPIRRGGGVAFGPHPRDFSTELPRKIYDLAWRTALSYRYRKGELIIIKDEIRGMNIPDGSGGRLLSNIFEGNRWGKGHGRSLLVTKAEQKTLFKGMETVGEHGRVKTMHDVDVKNLLETGRIVIEKSALDALLLTHASDLGRRLSFGEVARYKKLVSFDGRLMLGRRTSAIRDEMAQIDPYADASEDFQALVDEIVEEDLIGKRA